ncbi:MAG: 23S rRNA (uracil(1939)-C(5))-methyltransferase RlmD [Gammaproteobacteria bacterium]|nr:23S rRNA (uracil(1939)-C(5))-methyltransferase RlmD [Gammaproteobacteria bacterium]
MSRRRVSLPKDPVAAHVVDLTHEGVGVARVDGKTVFIDRALPGEDVHFIYTQRKRNYDHGKLDSIDAASSLRVEPACPHFGMCGGCSLQHMQAEQQIHFKQKVLLDNLERIGHVQPEQVRAPITGPLWGYRRKARLGVRYVEKKQKLLIGFREAASRYLADLSVCKVLHPAVGEHLEDIAQCIRSLSCYQAIPQIEVAVGDDNVALVIRHLAEFTEQDQQNLVAFARQYHYDIYTQAGGPDTITPLWPQQPALYYGLQEYDLRYDFLPSDFVQVNAEINHNMIAAVLQSLELASTHRVLELFCGLGNFTLPIAQRCQQVIAVEGEAGLVERARENARKNGIKNAEFHVTDLMQTLTALPWWHKQQFDRVFLDPPRSGASEVLPLFAQLKPPRIVYVSCNPSTLARDAGILCREQGYRLREAGVMDMFPHTAHVESIAVFVRED